MKIWMTLLTLATIVLAYGQYGATLGDQRPILDIHKVEAPAEVTKAYGEFSHYHVVKNSGKVTAHDVTFTVITLRNTVELHKDTAHNVGALVPGGEIAYEIHVHDHQMAKFDLSRETLTEEVVINYKGEKTPLRFWCTPVYKTAMVWHVHSVYKKWLRHPQKPSTFEADCG